MGAELGATSSLFPSDDQTRAFLRAQQREHAWTPLAADADAEYDDVIALDMSGLEPLVAKPHSPDNVAPAADLHGTRLHQVAIGSCTNSSYRDLMTVAAILDGKHIHPGVSLVIAPGSRQVLEMLADNGALAKLIAAGARILESSCGPCIGMGQAPPSGGATLRSFNRNFAGRCGTPDADTYLAGVEVCAASALTGEIADPRALGDPVSIASPETFLVDDDMIIPPADQLEHVEIVRGPNIAPVPTRGPLEDTLRGKVLLTVGDNITTDDIMPAGAKILPLRSNIPAISEFVFSRLDPGQGSSREHAALAPMALGLRAVLARSFARIHHANLVNFGILPLRLPEGQPISQGDDLEIADVRARIEAGRPLLVRNLTESTEFETTCDLTPRQARILLAGGLLNHIKQGGH
jgi:aconitate hydratase